ncbi:hypothetical protein A3C26_01650 [Candidatus Daviesbacteria bacterium RIFCSPHIGHO2_02_FULL_39_12]|uniref:Uncharacterized protein n=2 Tax=Candidatus Daviesiibacteriota TaxID=1752718 RepID=A0A1F5JCQ0_9BACT|nr:MAG: hypothetical protein A3C26_01650 [Candidatus Daviesbacteria bacterium RIFCSPHIGHO2_02_FULL_39_12]OGE72879.1 MAG: hypothetical protein A3H40_01890 [Candidatus Daviesbacteria bacterium RIFCSPLOWO2_02_FULL_38_15]
MIIPGERLTVFGDIKGMGGDSIRTFLRVTPQHIYGGSYPTCENGRSNEEVIQETGDLLIRAGLPNPLPINPCSSAEDRIERILQDCRARRPEEGLRLFVIDNNPTYLLAAARSLLDNTNPLRNSILKAMTVIQLGTTQPFDHVDTITGARVVNIPSYLVPFPTHPTAAF